MVPDRSSRRQPRPPLDEAKLGDLALHYVGRFATSRAKLVRYLERKISERGWDDRRPPAPAELAERLAGLGYIDDAAFAAARARSLGARGYGRRRVSDALHAAGIGDEDRGAAVALAETAAVESALRFAERKRIGPFAVGDPGPVGRDKAVGAMLRAGHRFALAKAIASLAPGSNPDREWLETLS